MFPLIFKSNMLKFNDSSAANVIVTLCIIASMVIGKITVPVMTL